MAQYIKCPIVDLKVDGSNLAGVNSEKIPTCGISVNFNCQYFEYETLKMYERAIWQYSCSTKYFPSDVFPSALSIGLLFGSKCQTLLVEFRSYLHTQL